MGSHTSDTRTAPPFEQEFVITGRDLREVRWRAFLAGFDASRRDGPLEHIFEEWCERERNLRLDELGEMAR